jgi:hypothetical protein
MAFKAEKFFSFTGYIIGVFSIIFSIYTYYDTRPSRQVSVNVKHFKLSSFNEISNKFQSINIKINDFLIGENIKFLNTIRITNNSNLEIEPSHIINAISVYFPANHNVVSIRQIDLSSPLIVDHDDIKKIELKPLLRWLPGAGVEITTLSPSRLTDTVVFGSIRGIRSISGPELDFVSTVRVQLAKIADIDSIFFYFMIFLFIACFIIDGFYRHFPYEKMDSSRFFSIFRYSNYIISILSLMYFVALLAFLFVI